MAESEGVLPSSYEAHIGLIVMHYLDHIELDGSDAWSHSDWALIEEMKALHLNLSSLLPQLREDVQAFLDSKSENGEAGESRKSRVEDARSTVREINRMIGQIEDEEAKSEWNQKIPDLVRVIGLDVFECSTIL